MMRVFTDDTAYDYERFPELSKRKYQYKETQEGVSTMCEVIEDYYAKRSADDIAAAEARTAAQFIIRMIKSNLPLTNIVEYSTMSVSAIRELAKQNNLQLVE